MQIQVELHRHLDVSIRISTLLKLAQSRGIISLSTTEEELEQQIVLRSPLASLEEVLARLSICQKVLYSPEILEQVAFETVEDCWKDGTQILELRFSPSFVSEFNSLTWQEILESFEKGIQKAIEQYKTIKVGLICIASRDYGPEGVDETVEFYLRNFNRFVGVDLAGNESHFPCHLYQHSFQKVKIRNGKITVHAGEGAGPENIWEAIQLLGAQRIGHGVSSIQDPLLMKYLAKNKICLEMCPTSNWITHSVKSLVDHPLPQLLKFGVPVSISTDDPTIFGVTLSHEIEICRQKLAMTDFDLNLCQKNAFEASFLTALNQKD